MRNEYRIVRERDIYYNEIRLWYWPFWIRFVDGESSFEDAADWAVNHAKPTQKPKVTYLGRLP